jgi:hypothetical protein
MWAHDKGPYRLVLNTKAAHNLQWHCKHYVSRRVMKKFGSGQALADEMKIPLSQLASSFAAYNAAADPNGPGDPFGKVYFTNAPFEVDDAFFVAQVTPVVHYTMGGLAISPKSECVYEASSRAIPGLYAAGELAGGIHGQCCPHVGWCAWKARSPTSWRGWFFCFGHSSNKCRPILECSHAPFVPADGVRLTRSWCAPDTVMVCA